MDLSGCTVTATPVKSANDEREYRCIRLANNLNAVLISDPTVEKAAACMNVGVGHFQDPDEIPGLAHFLEHMLFLGTEKYPDETSYKAFLNSHGGRSNASTSTESTDYKFDIAAEHLEEILDRFSQFFICPLFTESATEREMNAVDSEFVKNLQNDDRRQYVLLKTLSDRDSHKFYKFATGNLKTLKDGPIEQGLNIRQHLIDFHKTHYSANRMNLAVLGREPLDTLQAWIVTKFSGIPDKSLPAYSYNGSPWTEKTLKIETAITPVKDVRELRILWPMPSAKKSYKEKPHEYLSSLLGHEGEGSILSKLKYLQLGNSLTAGLRISISNAALFSVAIALTEEGQRCPYDVADTVFRYIDEVRKAGPQERVFRERQLIDQVNFRFKEKCGSFDFVIDLAADLAQYGPEDVLTGPALQTRFDPDLIRECLECLAPDNAMIYMTSRVFEGKTDQQERWYSTQYSCHAIAPEVLEFWRGGPPPAPDTLWLARHMEAYPKPIGFARGEGPALVLPKPNPYIPEDFALKARGEAPSHPIKLLETEAGVLWFKQDDTFQQAKAAIVVHLIPSKELHSARSHVLSSLFTMLLEDALNEETYDATLAGLRYNLDLSEVGWNLIVRGYDHKLPTLLHTVLGRLVTFEADPKRFDVVKERLSRSYKNWDFVRVDDHAQTYQSWLLASGTLPLDERQAALAQVTCADVMEYKLLHLSQLYLECLVHGNLQEEHARSVYDSILGALKPSPLAGELRRSLLYGELEAGKLYIFRKVGRDPSELQSAVRNYYQMGHLDLRGQVILALLAQMVKAPCFAQLRTKEQLAYVVLTANNQIRGVDGFAVVVISKVMSPHLVDGRIEAFLSSFAEKIAEMKPEEFRIQVEALATKVLEKDKKLFDETDRLWREIKEHTYLWTRQQDLVDALRRLTLEEVAEFYRLNISGASTRRKMSVQVFGKEHPLPADAEEGAVLFAHQQSFADFQTSGTFFPCFV